MKTDYITNNYLLSRASIDAISDYAQQFFSSVKIDKRNIARYRLAIEELLINLLDQYGEGTPLTITTRKRFFRQCFIIEIEGASFDSFKADQESIGNYSTSLLKSIGVSPEYSYTNHKNIFTFKAKQKQKNPLISLLIAVVSALIIGFLGMLLPESVRSFTLNDILSPIHDTFLNVLGCAAGPMIFLSVAWGIYGIGDTSTLNKIGKKMILGFVGILAIVLVCSACAIFPFFKLNYASFSQGTSGFESIFRLILDIFPENIFSPFINGNSLQIIFLGAIIGIAMLFLGKRTSAVARAVEQINYIVQFLMEFISKLVPYFIFIVMIRFIWSDTLNKLVGVAKFFLIYACILFISSFVLVIIVSRHHKVNPFLLIKKGLPTFLIALTTASSAASFGTNLKNCESKYGVNSSIASFGVPLGMVMFKPATAIGFFSLSLFFAETYQIEFSVVWFIVAILIVIILAVATPPIPGGALTAYTIIFMQLGIPQEALAIALAIDVLVDFLNTGFNQFLLPFALIGQANRNGLLDYKKLSSKE